jgi:primary-amine oxidase
MPTIQHALLSHSYNLFLSLKGQEWHVDEITQLPEGMQPQITPEELIVCEDILRADARVCELAAAVGTYPLDWHKIAVLT